ncbi:MAG: NAD(P)H-dependent oxidoreductase [Pseudomonadota bacterium]
MTKILKIDGSMRLAGSVTRDLADKVVARLKSIDPAAEITTRDLTDDIPQIDETWIGANFTDRSDRTESQVDALALSERLIAELRAADTLVLAVPMYNFGVPAAVKAWIDQITRARETFRYTENGAVGLLTDRRAIIVTATGGTEVDGPMDFAIPYLRHLLGFIGIEDVTVVAAGRTMVDMETAVADAIAKINGLAA